MKVKFKGLFVLALAFVMGSAAFWPVRSFATANAAESVAAVEPATESQADLRAQNDEKEYCTATLEDDFADDSVIVVLKQSVSNYLGLASSKLQKLFGNLKFDSYKNIFSFPNASQELINHMDRVGYNQIIKLGLHNKSKKNVLSTVRLLEKLDFVKSAEPNYFYTTEPLNESEVYSNESTNNTFETTPNDPMLKDQWGLIGDYGIGAKDAWKITTGSEKQFVGVIDSGVIIHEDLSCTFGYDLCWPSDRPEYNYPDDDILGHGTAITGIIGATANNELGICGVSPKSKVLPLQVCGMDYSDHQYKISGEAILAAFELASNRIPRVGYGLKVLNYSLSGVVEDSAIRDAIRQYPGVVVCAVGNDAKNFEGKSCHNIPNLITVGAIKSDGDRLDESNYGEYVDIYAPGAQILSTNKEGSYGKFDGTSVAAPFVAGTAALIYARHPEVYADEVKQAIIDGAIPCTINTPAGKQSARRLSAIGALMSVEKAVKPLQFTNLQVSPKGAKWQTTIVNPNNFEVRVTYNERLCFEGDAKKYTNLVHLRTFSLAAGASKTVQIYDNATAGTMTACIETPYSGQTVRTVSYAYDLNSNGSMTAKYNRILGTPLGVDGQVPGYVDMKAISKSGATYDIEVINPNPYPISITYNNKLCFENDARWFKGLKDLVDTTVPAGGSKIVNISDNGTAHWAVVAINYTVDGTLFRRVSFADGLNNNGGVAHMNQPRNNEFSVTISFPKVDSVPQYVRFTPTEKIGWFFPGWKIKIENPNNFQVQVSYNSQMCSTGDAKNFTGLAHLVTIVIPANGSIVVTIDGNGASNAIGMCINYHYNGFDYRRVTYSNDFKVNYANLTYNQLRIN